MRPTERDIAARKEVLDILVAQSVESYVAYGLTAGPEWRHVGHHDHVVPQPDLVAAWSVAGGRISYHHSDPDERSLSPSDLRTLYNPGLEAIWAHCSSGSSYRASLTENVSIKSFMAEHEHLNSTVSKEMARDFTECLIGPGSLPPTTYRDLSDRAFCEALKQQGLISFTAISTEGEDLNAPKDPAFEPLVLFARAVMDRKWPQPPV